MRDRRQFIEASGKWLMGGMSALCWSKAWATSSVILPFANGERPLVQYPQKRPLIRQTSRPPQLETPFEVFNKGILTPNDAFFVRYHLGNVPTSIDPSAYRLIVQGDVKTPLTLTLDDLRTKFPVVEVVAVNQCSGNSRGFFQPRVAGGQLGHGGMGNARWRGIPLKAILEKAGIKAGAKQITFKGLDAPVLPATPSFVKALDVDHALDGEVMVAFAMNGDDLPMLNGYPVRLVVPGYFGTYWVKHLSEIAVLDHEFDGYFMSKAYRIPDNMCACVEPGTAAKTTRPIGRLAVRSFLTSLQDGAAIAKGDATLLRGIAFDGGSGIRDVAISINGGRMWRPATLGEDLGPYSFRPWQILLTVSKTGRYEILIRATSRSGEVQPVDVRWNPPGYQRNVVERVKVRVL